jgi:hypothetical protein
MQSWVPLPPGKGHDHHRYFLYGSIDGDYSDFKIEDGEVESWSD